MRVKYVISLVVLSIALMCAASGSSISKVSDQSAGLQLNIRKINDTITPEKPSEVEISLVNVSNKAIWVDKRLVLGYHINLYVLDDSGRAIMLPYPVVTLVLPKKDDFTRLEPGQNAATTIEISKDMLPEFARHPANWTFIAKVTIFDTGSQFGIHGWTGTLKSYVQLKVE